MSAVTRTDGERYRRARAKLALAARIRQGYYLVLYALIGLVVLSYFVNPVRGNPLLFVLFVLAVLWVAHKLTKRLVLNTILDYLRRSAARLLADALADRPGGLIDSRYWWSLPIGAFGITTHGTVVAARAADDYRELEVPLANVDSVELFNDASMVHDTSTSGGVSVFGGMTRGSGVAYSFGQSATTTSTRHDDVLIIIRYHEDIAGASQRISVPFGRSIHTAGETKATLDRLVMLHRDAGAGRTTRAVVEQGHENRRLTQ